MARPRLAHRYVGRNRNAGHGYPLHLRLRRQAAFYVSHVWGMDRLGYLLDFDRDRYLEEYWAGDPMHDGWAEGSSAELYDPEGWRALDPYGRDGGAGSPR